MSDRFAITDEDWQRTPASVQKAFTSLYHQLLMLEMRSEVYERQLAALREQVAQIDDLKAELAELRERLGQNSNNSSNPPSSDPPHQRHTTANESTARKRGGQVGHLLEGRASKQAKQVISEQAKGIIGTEGFGAYNWLSARRRQICWAHLKRDFQAMAERGGDSTRVGEALLKEVKEVFKLWHELRDAKISRREFQTRLEPVKQRVKRLLDQGASCEHKKTRHSSQRILKLRKSMWRFAQVEGVKPTNNSTERAPRPIT